MAFVVIIPARYASSRLPGKPLKDIAGLPMIQRVWQQACKSSASRVVIATDDGRIKSVAEAFGAEVCMTRGDHVSGTDRLQEVASQLNLAEDQVVVNVQGDEPLIPPVVIDQVASNLSMNEAAGVATLREAITLDEDLQNPNIVKVIASLNGFASYFSRAPIPWVRDKRLSEGCHAHRHIGIYAYRVAHLNRFVQWPVAPAEQAESLEQLRFVWNNVSIHVDDAIAEVPGGIDTEEDLKAVSLLF
ncbi:MAG: 3-deoxy-manno-octulosonate cytidylyltransferase [Gammaproteobacteria bacterium]|nr:3-deoxy-manno-octulosonate cytidylyltransferase [Gammaproteobacteria bacterium]